MLSYIFDYIYILFLVITVQEFAFLEQKMKKLNKDNKDNNNDLINIIILNFTRQIDKLKQEIRLTKHTYEYTESRIFRCILRYHLEGINYF